MLVLFNACAAAEPVGERFAGEVLSVRDRLGLFQDAFAAGSPVTGYYGYDPADMADVPSQPPHTRLYVSGGSAPSPLAVTLGGAAFDPFPDPFLRVRLTDGVAPAGDSCLIESPTRFAFEYTGGRDLLFPEVALEWDDPAGLALSSPAWAALGHRPTGLFPQGLGRLVVRDAETHAVVAEAAFTVGPVVAAPEPAAAVVLGVVTAVSVCIRRRRGGPVRRGPIVDLSGCKGLMPAATPDGQWYRLIFISKHSHALCSRLVRSEALQLA